MPQTSTQHNQNTNLFVSCMLFKSFGCFFLASSESVLSELTSLDESETPKHQPALQINIPQGAFKSQICKVLQSC